MDIVNMHEAKTHLSGLVEAVASGREREIVIARNGRPAARLVPIEPTAAGKRIGIAKGKFKAPASIDEYGDEIAKLFGAGE